MNDTKARKRSGGKRRVIRRKGEGFEMEVSGSLLANFVDLEGGPPSLRDRWSTDGVSYETWRPRRRR